jgi:hypothetical protein
MNMFMIIATAVCLPGVFEVVSILFARLALICVFALVNRSFGVSVLTELRRKKRTFARPASEFRGEQKECVPAPCSVGNVNPFRRRLAGQLHATAAIDETGGFPPVGDSCNVRVCIPRAKAKGAPLCYVRTTQTTILLVREASSPARSQTIYLLSGDGQRSGQRELYRRADHLRTKPSLAIGEAA